jgi:ribosome assembly protein YihI (activator of Der GTPase)
MSFDNNELPMEDYYVPDKLKSLKEMMFLEDDDKLRDYLDTLDEDSRVKFYIVNNSITKIDIIIKDHNV